MLLIFTVIVDSGCQSALYKVVFTASALFISSNMPCNVINMLFESERLFVI